MDLRVCFSSSVEMKEFSSNLFIFRTKFSHFLFSPERNGFWTSGGYGLRGEKRIAQPGHGVIVCWLVA